MGADKFVLVKGIAGMGNRILCALTGILYARLSKRKLLVDWSDEYYSSGRANVFHRFFRSPSYGPADEVPATDSVSPGIWRDRLHESAWSMRARHGDVNDSQTWRMFSVDLTRLDHPEDIVVLWTYTAKVGLLRRHMADAPAEPAVASDEMILRKLFREGLVLAAEVRTRVDRFKQDHFEGRTIGVHVRYTDHRTRLRATIGKLDELLRQDPSIRIFLSTDNIQIKRLFDEVYSRVVGTPHWCSRPGRPLHFGPGRPDPAMNGIEALTDLYLLAECDDLIVDTSSSFSAVATLLTDAPAARVFDLKRRGKLSPRLRKWTGRLALLLGMDSWGLSIQRKLAGRQGPRPEAPSLAGVCTEG